MARVRGAQLSGRVRTVHTYKLQIIDRNQNVLVEHELDSERELTPDDMHDCACGMLDGLNEGAADGIRIYHNGKEMK